MHRITITVNGQEHHCEVSPGADFAVVFLTVHSDGDAMHDLLPFYETCLFQS